MRSIDANVRARVNPSRSYRRVAPVGLSESTSRLTVSNSPDAAASPSDRAMHAAASPRPRAPATVPTMETYSSRGVHWCGFVRLVAGFLQRSVAVLLPRSRRTGCR